MKKIYNLLIVSLFFAAACGDNELGVNPKNENYPFRLVMDAEEGADVADAEDYGIEVVFADYLGELPNNTITLNYEISDMEDDMLGTVTIDKVVYEVEIEDCVYERELDVRADGLITGAITIAPDPDLGSVPESFEIIVTLPGFEGASGSFVFTITSLQSSDNVILGLPAAFKYEVLDAEVAGEWEFEFSNEDEFDDFKEVFGTINAELASLEFEDVTGKVTAEFEFEEMKFVVELVEEEEVTTCENGDQETEIVNKVIEIEAEYDAEDGEIELEGSHEVEDDGAVVELDFKIEAEYGVNEGELTLTFFRIIDEDNQGEGNELFLSAAGISFIFAKD
jgi:hypothetical protein